MIVDGRAIACELKEELRSILEKSKKAPSLAVFTVDSSLVTDTFISIKKAFASDIGVLVKEVRYSKEGVDTDLITKEIASVASVCDGIIVQFPLPPTINGDIVRNTIPISNDVDVISDAAIERFKQGDTLFPPVVGAIKEVLERHEVPIFQKRVVIVGKGRLVGRPTTTWFRLMGADVDVVDVDTKDISKHTKKADILVLGAGVPGLVRPYMVSESAVLLDAGASESNGQLMGDADQKCAEKVSLFTPVPGGIGPITVAMIFKNLLYLRDACK